MAPNSVNSLNYETPARKRSHRWPIVLMVVALGMGTIFLGLFFFARQPTNRAVTGILKSPSTTQTAGTFATTPDTSLNIHVQPITASPDVPTVFMPQQVYRVLKAAVESFQFRDSDESELKENMEGLEKLRKTPWPDIDRMKWVRIYNSQKPSRSGMAWCLSESPTELTVILPNLTLRHIPRKEYSKIEVVEYRKYLEQLVEYLLDRKENKKRPWDFTYIDDFGAGGLPHYGGVFLMYHAVGAAWIGKEDAVIFLVHEALRQNPLVMVMAYNDGAWQSFSHGIWMLEEGKPRSDVLNHWDKTLHVYNQSHYQKDLEDMIGQLRMQVKEDQELAKLPIKEPSQLPLEQQVQYYMARLGDVHGEQYSQPGHCMTIGMGEGTAISDALVKIGRPAVPTLIAHLDDRRLTRSIGYSRNFDPNRTVLRYQDVCVQCIDRILDINFYRPSSTSSYLSNEKQEVHDRVVKDIKEWWKLHGKESPLAGQLARLEAGNIYERLDTLRKIEQLDQKAVNSIEILKKWAKSATEEELPHIAEALAERGNLALLPEIRKCVQSPDMIPNEYCIWYLMKHGTIGDYCYLRKASRREIAHGVKLGSQCIWGAVLGGIEIADKPIVVPLLVDFLGQRELTGSRYRAGYKQAMAYSAADSCIEALVRLTGHDEGYKGDDPPERRFAVMDRWIAWWIKEGQVEYVRKHPEIAKVLAAAEELPATQRTP